MKLLKLYIYSFGKLEDFYYDFNDELNEIKEENGWGKSTLSYFIKSMFYGLSGDRKRDVSQNERERFRPWNSNLKFGGFIEFTWAEKKFKIERYFGKKESEDTVKLIDLATGKGYDDDRGWGKRIFEIDEEGFFSTTYFSQSDFEITGNASITEKYNSICGDNAMSDAFEMATKRLEAEKKELLSRGDKGKIPDLKRAIRDCEDKIKELKSRDETCNELRLQKSQATDEIARLKTKTEELDKRLVEIHKAEAVKIKRDNLKNLVSEKDESVYELNEQTKIFNGNKITREEIAAGKECVKSLSKENERLYEINSRIGAVSEKMGANSLDKKHNSDEGKKNTNVVLSAVCVAFAVITVVLWVLCKSIGVIPGLIGLVVTIAVVSLSILFLRRKNKSFKTKENEIDGKTLALKSEYERLKEEGIKLADIKHGYETRLKEYLSKFDVDKNDFSASFYRLESALEQTENLKKRINDLSGKIAALESDKDLSAVMPEIESADAIKAERKRSSEELEEFLKLERTYAEKIARIESETASIPDLENKFDEYEERLAEYKERYDVLSKTYDYLQTADENLKVKYRRPLEEAFNKYLKLIDGKEMTAEIDIDLNVFIIENGERKETGYYSKGYRDLFEICKRFALTDVLFKKEKPFIILDDPFYNLDDEKLSSATALIKELSKEYQIIYLICHESRRA